MYYVVLFVLVFPVHKTLLALGLTKCVRRLASATDGTPPAPQRSLRRTTERPKLRRNHARLSAKYSVYVCTNYTVTDDVDVDDEDEDEELLMQ